MFIAVFPKAYVGNGYCGTVALGDIPLRGAEYPYGLMTTKEVGTVPGRKSTQVGSCQR